MSCTCKEAEAAIPIIEFGELDVNNQGEPSESEWNRVSKEITDAFENVGFAYISGHGIPVEHVIQVMNASGTFFNLPIEIKEKYAYSKENYHGYVGMNVERLDPTSGYENELRESFNIKNAEENFPDEEIPEFRQASKDFLESCNKLAHRIFTAISLGLDLRRNFFSDAHRLLRRAGSSAVARILHYPPVPDEKLKNSIRCGEHSDYGTVTLLFQDEVGGLQVRDASGSWINAKPIPGTVLVNIGDLLQLWTSGKFKATKHRVIIPNNEIQQNKVRRSLAYFLHPDDDQIIKPLDGSKEFQSITGRAYLEQRVAATYKQSRGN